MVQNILQNYKCPFCSATAIHESNIDIVGAAGNTVNIDMHCPSCKKHFMAKTEIVHMELGNISKDKMWEIQNALSALKGKLGWNIDIESNMDSAILSEENSIQEEEILEMRKSMLQNNFEVKDLFTEGK